MNQRKYTKKKMAMKDCKESRERKSIRSIVRSQSRKQKPVMRYVLWAFHCSIRRFVLSDCTSTGSTDCSETKTNTSFYSLDINLNPRLASPMLWGVKAGYAFSTFFFLFFLWGYVVSTYCGPLKAICAHVWSGKVVRGAFIQRIFHFNHQK